jgi:hypothetical protein
MRNLFLWSAALALAGCGGSTPSIDGADPCAKPVQIPAGWLDDQQIELLWGQDRRALLDCADKVESLSGRKPR